MPTARDLLLSTVEEKRPLILLLGQGAWRGLEQADTLLATALQALGRVGEPRRGWAAMLDVEPVPGDHYDWLAERFERRVHPQPVEMLSELPWSAVFTSSIDPTLTKLLSRRGRQAEPILTANENPRAARSTVRPPLYYLFSRAGEQDPEAQPPLDRMALNTRRIRHSVPMLNRVLDTATSLGTIVVDGFSCGDDWLRFEDLLGMLGNAMSNQVLWFGGHPALGVDDAGTFTTMEEVGQIVVYPMRLGTVVAELQVAGWLADVTPVDSEDAGVVSLGDGVSFSIAPEERLRVEAVASIVDDSWTSFLPPLGADSNYDAFRRFHGDLGGSRLLVEGVRRGFAIERDFERHLFNQVADALMDHARHHSPIIVEGQSGTGKSVALARLVARIRETKVAPVLYSIGRIPHPEEVSSFCQAAERAGAQATLIVCDVNRDVDSYDELLSGLRSRGRRVVVVGSQYLSGEHDYAEPCTRTKAPAMLSEAEGLRLANLLEDYFEVAAPSKLHDHHFLAFLYRYLPASRPRIGSGLGAEARAAERLLDERGSRPRAVLPITQLHQQLLEKGFLSNYEPIFDGKQIETLEGDQGSAGRIIDFIMVAGSLDCAVPVNLLLRAVSARGHRMDSALISELFRDLDLVRWELNDAEGSEWLLLPRLTLEAQLICRRRLGNPQSEATILVELIGSVRQGIDNTHELDFLLSLLQQVGRDGPQGNRYRHAYVDFARKLTELRERFNVVDARLMLQESAFRRSAVREGEVNDDRQLELLEEARGAVQTALDEIDNGQLRAARRTRQYLLVERASVYGFLATNRAQRMNTPVDIWSAYQAARVAVRQAVSVSDNYYPHDVGLWIPDFLFKSADLTASQRAELAADIYSTLDQVEHDTLLPTQRDRFERRRMSVGLTLGDHKLTGDAYTELEKAGSTAGYFLRAREYAPDLARDDVEITRPADLAKAKRAADFLTAHLDKIQQDERCLSLLLESRWISEMQRRPLHGERQPLPVGDVRRQILGIVRALNEAAGESSRYGTRYLEAVLTWLTEDYTEALEIFRQLYRETDNVYRGRIFRRHVVSDPNGTALSFTGRIERQLGEGRWQVRIGELNQTIALLERDFPREHVQYGRTLSGFAIAFNFIGPIADPMRS